MAGGGLVIAKLGRVNPGSLPDDIGLGIATPGDVPELLALWAVAAENESQPRYGPGGTHPA